MGKRINWTALANAEPEFIDALLVKERIERKAKHVEIMTQRRSDRGIRACHRPVGCPDCDYVTTKRRPIMTRKAKQTKSKSRRPLPRKSWPKPWLPAASSPSSIAMVAKRRTPAPLVVPAASSRKMVSGTA